MSKYNHTIKLNDESLVFRKDIDDPFVRLEILISRWDRFKTLFKKDLRVTVIIDGDRDTIGKVMNLDRVDWTGIWESDDSSVSTNG